MTAPADLLSSSLHQDLLAEGAVREAAVARLHALLLRVSRSEAHRRRGQLPEQVRAEVDDLCHQATHDAVMSILRRLNDFRGEARFTTWACKFVIFEISARLRRHAWRERAVERDDTVWERIPDLAPSPLRSLEHRELVTALRGAVEDRLTERQRMVFEAAAIDDVPIDVLAERLGSSRGAVYKMLHDARRKLRGALSDAGYAEYLA